MAGCSTLNRLQHQATTSGHIPFEPPPPFPPDPHTQTCLDVIPLTHKQKPPDTEAAPPPHPFSCIPTRNFDGPCLETRSLPPEFALPGWHGDRMPLRSQMNQSCLVRRRYGMTATRNECGSREHCSCSGSRPGPWHNRLSTSFLSIDTPHPPLDILPPPKQPPYARPPPSCCPPASQGSPFPTSCCLSCRAPCGML